VTTKGAADPAALAAQFLDQFVALGAQRVEPGYLLPAEMLLDLYGEDIRARAYRTDDPVLGEQMLRPDFTVPILRAHLTGERAAARYAYAGPVWRRQAFGSSRPNEFWQAGFEIVGDADRAANDALVFTAIAQALEGHNVTPITGDLSIIFAAIDALSTTDARKTALRRHVWRPRRFERLLNRFVGTTPFDCDTREPRHSDAPHLGLRSQAEVTARLERLAGNTTAEALSNEDMSLMSAVLNLRGTAPACLAGLQVLAKQFTALDASAQSFEARLEALAAQGVDVDALGFDGALLSGRARWRG